MCGLTAGQLRAERGPAAGWVLSSAGAGRVRAHNLWLRAGAGWKCAGLVRGGPGRAESCRRGAGAGWHLSARAELYCIPLVKSGPVSITTSKISRLCNWVTRELIWAQQGKNTTFTASIFLCLNQSFHRSVSFLVSPLFPTLWQNPYYSLLFPIFFGFW